MPPKGSVVPPATDKAGDPVSERPERAVKNQRRAGIFMTDPPSENDIAGEHDDEYLPNVETHARSGNRAKSKSVAGSRAPKTTPQRTQKVPEEEPEHDKQIRQAIEKIPPSIWKHYKKSKTAWKTESDYLRQQIEAKDEEIERLKAAGLRAAAQHDFHGELDDSIVEKFQDLMTRIQDWTRYNSFKLQAAQLDADLKLAIVQMLSNGPKPSTSNPGISILFQGNLSTSTILSSLLNKLLFERMLDNTFFFLKSVYCDQGSMDLQKAIGHIRDLGREVNPSGSQVWLSQTMTLLHSSESQLRNNDQMQHSKCQQLKQHSYWKVTTGCLGDPVILRLLKRVDDAEAHERENSLLSIVTAFGQYILKLRTQKACMEMLSYNQLQKVGFKIGSTQFKPHPTLGLDTDDHSCDGKPILFVVRPGILARGDENGKNYDQLKVWSPAIVLVQQDRRHMPPSIWNTKGNNNIEAAGMGGKRDCAEETAKPVPTMESMYPGTRPEKELTDSPLSTPLKLSDGQDCMITSSSSCSNDGGGAAVFTQTSRRGKKDQENSATTASATMKRKADDSVDSSATKKPSIDQKIELLLPKAPQPAQSAASDGPTDRSANQKSKSAEPADSKFKEEEKEEATKPKEAEGAQGEQQNFVASVPPVPVGESAVGCQTG